MHNEENNLQDSTNTTRTIKSSKMKCPGILRRVRVTTVAAKKKAISITYSECMSVALVIQHAMRMRCIILSSVACPAAPYFSILSHKRYNFRGGGNVFNIKLCFDFLYNLSKTFVILRRRRRGIITNVLHFQVKHPLFSADFNETSIFSTDFRKTRDYQIS